MMRAFLIALALLGAAAFAGGQETEERLPGGGLFFDTMPLTVEGHILAPVRPLVEWTKGRVAYDRGEVKVYEEGAVRPRLEMVVGSKEARLSGAPYTLDLAAQVIDGRLYGPLKFIADALGVWVEPEGRGVRLRVPQLDREVEMAIPPDPGSHQAKIWKQLGIYYGLPAPTPVDVTALPHWNLFSAERKRELIVDLGRDAPTILEAHWGERGVAGIRVLSEAVDVNGGAATVQVMVKYADDAVYEDSFSFVLEPEGWRIRRENSTQRD